MVVVVTDYAPRPVRKPTNKLADRATGIIKQLRRYGTWAPPVQTLFHEAAAELEYLLSVISAISEGLPEFKSAADNETKARTGWEWQPTDKAAGIIERMRRFGAKPRKQAFLNEAATEIENLYSVISQTLPELKRLADDEAKARAAFVGGIARSLFGNITKDKWLMRVSSVR